MQLPLRLPERAEELTDVVAQLFWLAVVVGLRTAASGTSGGAVTSIGESALQALTKVEQILPSALRRKVSALASQLVAVPPDRATATVDRTLREPMSPSSP